MCLLACVHAGAKSSCSNLFLCPFFSTNMSLSLSDFHYEAYCKNAPSKSERSVANILFIINSHFIQMALIYQPAAVLQYLYLEYIVLLSALQSCNTSARTALVYMNVCILYCVLCVILVCQAPYPTALSILCDSLRKMNPEKPCSFHRIFPSMSSLSPL